MVRHKVLLPRSVGDGLISLDSREVVVRQQMFGTQVKPEMRFSKVDAKARELIEQARGAGWETLNVSNKSQRTEFQVIYNGAVQFLVDRTTAEGLR